MSKLGCAVTCVNHIGRFGLSASLDSAVTYVTNIGLSCNCSHKAQAEVLAAERFCWHARCAGAMLCSHAVTRVNISKHVLSMLQQLCVGAGMAQLQPSTGPQRRSQTSLARTTASKSTSSPKLSTHASIECPWRQTAAYTWKSSLRARIQTFTLL